MSRPHRLPEALCWVIVYLGWAASSALALLVAFTVRRAVLSLIVALRVNPWYYAAVDKWMMFGLALASLGFIIYAQHYYVQGYPGDGDLGTFPRRFARVSAIEVALLALGSALTLLAS